jgi:hypothetical protein
MDGLGLSLCRVATKTTGARLTKIIGTTFGKAFMDARTFDLDESRLVWYSYVPTQPRHLEENTSERRSGRVRSAPVVGSGGRVVRAAVCSAPASSARLLHSGLLTEVTVCCMGMERLCLL